MPLRRQRVPKTCWQPSGLPVCLPSEIPAAIGTSLPLYFPLSDFIAHSTAKPSKRLSELLDRRAINERAVRQWLLCVSGWPFNGWSANIAEQITAGTADCSAITITWSVQQYYTWDKCWFNMIAPFLFVHIQKSVHAEGLPLRLSRLRCPKANKTAASFSLCNVPLRWMIPRS